jgi:hypothetical protein
MRVPSSNAAEDHAEERQTRRGTSCRRVVRSSAVHAGFMQIDSRCGGAAQILAEGHLHFQKPHSIPVSHPTRCVTSLSERQLASGLQVGRKWFPGFALFTTVWRSEVGDFVVLSRLGKLTDREPSRQAEQKPISFSAVKFAMSYVQTLLCYNIHRGYSI